MSATASCPSMNMVSTVLTPVMVMVVVVVVMMVVMTRKCSPLRSRDRRKLRQRWSQVHSRGVWRLMRVILLLLLENGWRQRLWNFYCWWRLMTTKGSAIGQHIDPFKERLPFEIACRRGYDILLAFPRLWNRQGCPSFCFVFGPFPTLVNHLDIVVKYCCDHGYHVSFDDPCSNAF